MKPRYERPVIARHAVGAVSKFGVSQGLRVIRDVDGVAISELIEKYGSPLFVFSERKLRERFSELRDQLARRFADFTIAWSYKTNYLSGICRVFHSEGAWAEVVSGMEMQKALDDGVPGRQIIFNGPGKREEDLDLAFREGVQVHIDHLDELTLAEKVAERLGITPEVGIRLSISELPVPHWDRFGFNLESGRAMEAVRRILRGGQLDLRVLHCHIGTFIQEPDAYRMAAKAVGEFAVKIQEELGVRIDTIDLGGGFASHNTLHSQYLPGEEISPSISQYVERISRGFEEAFEGQEMPRLVLETGRAMVDDSAVLIASVIGNKRLIDGRRAVIIDAGVNILPTSRWYRHKMNPAQEARGTMEPTVFFGPLCMNIDVVRDRIMFPPLRTGERVVIGHVGAYNVTQWLQFIAERPNVVMVSPRGETALLRRSEGLEALTRMEEVPPWLAS